MAEPAESEVETVALYGAIFGAVLLLLSAPGRQLVRHSVCVLFRWAASVDATASVATAGVASPGLLPSPFGPPISPHGDTALDWANPGGSLGSLGSAGSLRKGAGQTKSPLQAFWAFLHIGDFEIMRDVGSDAALYLRFQRMVIKLLLPMSLADIFILAPLHARATAEGSSLAGVGEAGIDAGDRTVPVTSGVITQFMRSTTAHNLPAHSWVLWVDLAMFYAFSLIIFRFIHHFQRDILCKFNSIESQTAATACTALVRNIPKEDTRRQVNLMQQQAKAVTEREEKGGGLVIVKAIYGVLDNASQKRKNTDNNATVDNLTHTMDATTQLQFWVVDSSLHLPAISKKHMLGFYDPIKFVGEDEWMISDEVEDSDKRDYSFGQSIRKWWDHKLWESKKTRDLVVVLSIRYKLDEVMYEVMFNDDEAVELPSKIATQVNVKDTS